MRPGIIQYGQQQNQQQSAGMRSTAPARPHKHSAAKSATKGSLETKSQSASRSSPSAHKQKPAAKSHRKPKPPLKMLNKLTHFIEAITDELAQLDKQSALGSLSTSMGSSKGVSAQGEGRDAGVPALAANRSTVLMCGRIREQTNRNQGMQPHQQSAREQDTDLKQVQSYMQLFDSALGQPHNLRRITISSRRAARPSISLTQQLRHFKQQQNDNWSYINKQLCSYLTGTKQQQQDSSHYNKINQLLQKQARTNYRWLQLQDKLLTQGRLQEIKAQKEPIAGQQMQDCQFLRYYNEEKYVWREEVMSSSSELMAGDDSSSDYVHVNTADLLDECQMVQENVDLLVNWLINQFVVELAGKLDLNTFFKDDGDRGGQQQEPTNTVAQHSLLFIRRINQIADDCLQVDSIGKNKQVQIQPMVKQAFIEVVRANPSLGTLAIKAKLKRLISSRQYDYTEFFVPDEQEQYEWIRLAVVTEIEEMVWQSLVIEQACQLVG